MNEIKSADNNTKEINELIKKHIEPMFGSLESASLKHFLETGKVSGSFRFRLSYLIADVLYQESNPQSPQPAADISDVLQTALEYCYELKGCGDWKKDAGGKNQKQYNELSEFVDKISAALSTIK